MKNILGLASLLTIVSCSHVEVLDQKDAAERHSRALAQASIELTKTQEHLELHQRILASAAKEHALKAQEPLQQALKIKKSCDMHFGQWRQLVADYASYSHNSPRVSSQHPKWSDSQARIVALAKANSDYNQSFEALNLKLKELSRYWNENRIYQTAQLDELMFKLNQASRDWRELFQQRNEDLASSQDKIDQYQSRAPASLPEMDKKISALQVLHKSVMAISELVFANDALIRKLQENFSGRTQIDSLDPQWSEYQSIVKQSQQMGLKFDQLNRQALSARDEL